MFACYSRNKTNKRTCFLARCHAWAYPFGLTSTYDWLHTYKQLIFLYPYVFVSFCHYVLISLLSLRNYIIFYSFKNISFFHYVDLFICYYVLLYFVFLYPYVIMALCLYILISLCLYAVVSLRTCVYCYYKHMSCC